MVTSGSDEIRVLFLHPPEWSDERVRAALGRITQVAAKAASTSLDPRTRTAKVRTVSAREDWGKHVRARRPSTRIIDAWVREIATGKQSDDQPTYHTFVVTWGELGPTGPVDPVAARIIARARKANKPVLTWNPEDDRAAPVVDVAACTAATGRVYILQVQETTS